MDAQQAPVAMVMVVLLALLTGCAAPQEDRFESANRKVRAFNDAVDSVVTRPLAQGYVAVTPEPVRDGVTNFFNNLGYPAVILNQFLQGKPKLGAQDTARLVINSTVGIGGIFDVAGASGLPRHQEDFGQTFGVWGLPMGDYFVLPIWGGVTTRGAFGDLLGAVLFLPRYMGEAEHRVAVIGLNAVNLRSQVLGQESLIQGDRYIFLRDSWIQRRAFLTNDGEVDDAFLDDAFLDDDF